MIRKFHTFFMLIKFEHSLFALPFAYLGMVLAERGLPSLKTFVLVTLAMLFARTFGMTINRFVDLEIDRKNPRTHHRVVMFEYISHAFMWFAVFASAFLFLAAIYFMPKICLVLSPIPLFTMVIYPYLKRFTWFSHIVLGLILAMAPVGGWIAVTGSFAMLPILMAGSVATWVAGFDIIYALQDYHFDREQNLHSAPARWGRDNAIFASRLLHTLTIVLFFAIVFRCHGGFIAWAAFAFSTALILREHMILEEEGLRQLENAFFTANAWISVIFFMGIFADLLMR